MKQQLIDTVANYLAWLELTGGEGEDMGSLENLLLSSYLKVAQGQEAYVLLATHDEESGVSRISTHNVADTVYCLRSLADGIEEAEKEAEDGDTL